MPVIVYTASDGPPYTGPSPFIVSFTSNATQFGTSVWTGSNWAFGDGYTTEGQTAVHTYNTPGTYYPTVQVFSTGGSAYPTLTPIVVTAPVVTYQAGATPTSGPDPLTVEFTSGALSNGVEIWETSNWVFGDGSTSTLQNPIHTYSSVGTFNPSVTVTNTLASGSGTPAVPSITVTAPATSYSATRTPVSGSNPLTVSFTSGATVLGSSVWTSSTWAFGDGTTSTAQNPTHTYTAPGTYSASVVINNTATLYPGPTTSTIVVPGVTPGAIYTSIGPNTITLKQHQLDDAEFSAIRLRTMQSTFPTNVYDNGNYPLRNLSFWPVPNEVNIIELWMWEPLTIYSLDDELDLPPGYERFLRFKLAVELQDEFGKKAAPQVTAIASEAEANLKSLNQQMLLSFFSERARTLSNRTPAWTYITMIAGDALPTRW